MQTDLIAFLTEIIQRLKQKSPKFFKVWNVFNSILFVIAGIPVLLTQFGFTDLNILPAYVLKIITFASAWGLFMNKLTVKSSSVVVTDGNTVIQKPSDKLPFTEKKEAPVIVDSKMVL